MKNKTMSFLAGAMLAFVLLLGVAFMLPPVRTRLQIYATLLRARIKYAIHPPQEQVFLPVGNATAAATPSLSPTSTPTPTPTLSPTPGPTPTPTVTPSPTPSPTPLPKQAHLNLRWHEYQKWNNCGPATLSMALHYWGWSGNQDVTAAFLKPNQRDKNVSPYEMANFVAQKTPYGFIWRYGGDLHLLKALIANGFPVMVEKGFYGAGFEGWMGHYELLIGYDDAKKTFYAQDSYRGPNYPVSYDAMRRDWRAFNYIFLLPYDKALTARLMAVLGPWADSQWAARHALEIATAETKTLTGRPLFFAWYNVGTSHVWLHEYVDAAHAYDQAFAVYAQLPKDERPWRMLWYQTGPYFAYYYSGRYQDVINLATTTLDAMNEPVLEESYYWRALAEAKLGQRKKAIADLEEAVRLNPHFVLAWNKLRELQNGG